MLPNLEANGCRDCFKSTPSFPWKNSWSGFGTAGLRDSGAIQGENRVVLHSVFRVPILWSEEISIPPFLRLRAGFLGI